MLNLCRPLTIFLGGILLGGVAHAAVSGGSNRAPHGDFWTQIEPLITTDAPVPVHAVSLAPIPSITDDAELAKRSAVSLIQQQDQLLFLNTPTSHTRDALASLVRLGQMEVYGSLSSLRYLTRPEEISGDPAQVAKIEKSFTDFLRASHALTNAALQIFMRDGVAVDERSGFRNEQRTVANGYRARIPTLRISVEGKHPLNLLAKALAQRAERPMRLVFSPAPELSDAMQEIGGAPALPMGEMRLGSEVLVTGAYLRAPELRRELLRVLNMDKAFVDASQSFWQLAALSTSRRLQLPPSDHFTPELHFSELALNAYEVARVLTKLRVDLRTEASRRSNEWIAWSELGSWAQEGLQQCERLQTVLDFAEKRLLNGEHDRGAFTVGSVADDKFAAINVGWETTGFSFVGFSVGFPFGRSTEGDANSDGAMRSKAQGVLASAQRTLKVHAAFFTKVAELRGARHDLSPTGVESRVEALLTEAKALPLPFPLAQFVDSVPVPRDGAGACGEVF